MLHFRLVHSLAVLFISFIVRFVLKDATPTRARMVAGVSRVPRTTFACVALVSKDDTAKTVSCATNGLHNI